MIHNISRFITALALLATATTAWAQSSFSGGSGTQADPYKISSSADLVQLATDINNSTSRLYEDQYFVQTGNINMSGINFVPIGINDNSYHQFRGKYNGQNYTISNLTVNGSYDYAGLFGYIYNGDIDNVRLVSPSITNTKTSYTSALVGFGNMPGIHNCLVISPTLSGGNSIGVFAGGQNAGNIKYTYYTGNNNYSNVGYTDGSNANTSIGHAYTLTLSGGATTSTTAAFTYNSTDYYAGTITLSNAAPAGWIYAYTVNGSPINGTSFTINADATVALSRTPDPTHFSDNGDGSYTIKTADGWNVFCDCLNDNDTYNRFSGKTVRLGDDITVTRMAGGDGHEFTGTFDGGGHTLTVNITGTVQGTAPFCEIKGATIRNLVVTGSVAGKRHSAGLVGFARGDDASVENTIENCLVATDVSIMGDDNGYLGGIVGHGLKCKLTIRGCAFTGSLTSESNYTGGLQGWSDGNTLILENDIFAATSVNAANVGFHPIAIHVNNASTTATVSNVYYTVEPTCTTSTRIAAAGKATRTVAAAAAVTIDAIALTGTATQYTVSGITAYSGGGLQRGQTLYYGSGDQLSLTLTTSAQCDQPGYQYAYTASAGTLSGNTLTMPDEDVTISVNTAALAPIDWATVNQGNSEEDPYMIYNKDQLLLLAHRVNGTNGETANSYHGKYFKLGADITFDHPVAEPDDYDENYEAIGGYTGGTYRNFKGNFDGDGHTVSGIRIRKTGSGDANSYQGLFGHIDGSADIHDVHLTDARITGYENVGGIAGLNYGTVSGCSVTDSYITATDNWHYGTICGWNGGTLTNNYYHGCTVNGTAATSGNGCNGADIAANHGALPAYAITLGANITTPPGTFAGQTEWLDTPPVNPRLAPENGFTLAGNHYFASGYVFTPGSTLASGAAQGYTPRATLGDELLDLYTPTGDNDPLAGTAIARLTITADCDGKTLASTQAIYSTGQPVTVAYINADGTPGEASAIALDGTETSLAAGWYFVGKDISYNATLTLGGDVTLILKDGCEMNVGESDGRISGYGIIGYNYTLDIYAQSLGDDMGALSIYNSGSNKNGIKVKALTVNGGNITADANGSNGFAINATTSNITVNGGNVTANSANYVAISSSDNIYINGGTVNATGVAQGISSGANIYINGGTVNATCTGSGYGIYSNGTIEINGGNVTASSIYASADDGTAITLGWTRPADRITASSISVPYGGTVAVADGQALTDGSGHIYTGTLTASELSGFAAETTLQPCLALADAADNSAAITDHAGLTLAVALSGRTLYKDGSWNTLCLPFDVDLTASGTLSGDNVQAMTLNTTTSNFADGTLTLNFAPATTIPAGTPFIIKWDNTGVNIENPVFEDVTVSNTTNDATIEGVLTFTGTYAPVSITDAAGDNTKLYLGAANKLYYPTKTMTIGTHRAYFQLLGDLTAGEPVSGSNAQQIRAFNLNFGDDESTGIISVHDSGFTVNASAAWYTLDGRRLDAQPTAKGLYIHGGKKVIVK